MGWEFYDLPEDSTDILNLHVDPKYMDAIADLKRQLPKPRQDLRDTDENCPRIARIIEENWDK